jgi:hydroxymethylpyrimidine pyrophosphatase-like HAD family hydrolase
VDHARRLQRLVRDRGLLLTYATARSHLMAERVTGAGWGTAAVVYNGAFTVEPDGGRVLRRHVLDPGVVRQVLMGARAHGLAPLVFDYDGTDHVQWVRGQETPGVTRYLTDRAGDRRFDPRPDWSDLRSSAVFYVSVIGTRDVVDALALELGRSVGPSCTINVQQDTYHPQDTWLEITPPGVTKASEVLALADMLDADRVVCFGDNQNDLSLFEAADEAYAVGNATPEVLARATSVIGTNEEGGVVAWLEEHGH